jgi:hypothetical protein
MNFDDALWQYLMLIANAFLIGAAALAVLRVQRELASLRQFWQSPAAVALMGDSYDDRGLRRMIDQRFLDLRAHLDSSPPAAAVAAPQALPPPPPGAMPLDYATRMARAGASVDDVVRGCGLNRGEAQLLIRLHSSKGPAMAPATH